MKNLKWVGLVLFLLAWGSEGAKDGQDTTPEFEGLIQELAKASAEAKTENSDRLTNLRNMASKAGDAVRVKNDSLNVQIKALNAQIDQALQSVRSKQVYGGLTYQNADWYEENGKYMKLKGQKAALESQLKGLTTEGTKAYEEYEKYNGQVAKLEAASKKGPPDLAKEVKRLQEEAIKLATTGTLDRALSKLESSSLQLQSTDQKLAFLEYALDQSGVGFEVRQKLQKFAESQAICDAMTNCQNKGKKKANRSPSNWIRFFTALRGRSEHLTVLRRPQVPQTTESRDSARDPASTDKPLTPEKIDPRILDRGDEARKWAGSVQDFVSRADAALKEAKREGLAAEAKALSGLFPSEQVEVNGKSVSLSRLAELAAEKGGEALPYEELDRELRKFKDAQVAKLESAAGKRDAEYEALERRVAADQKDPGKLARHAAEMKKLEEAADRDMKLYSQLTSEPSKHQRSLEAQTRQVASKLADHSKEKEVLHKELELLQQEVAEARAAEAEVKKKVSGGGCVCGSENSLPYGPNRQIVSLCVLRSAENGKPWAWSSETGAHCEQGCQYWLKGTDFHDRCSTPAFRNKLQADLKNATQSVAAAEATLKSHQERLAQDVTSIMRGNAAIFPPKPK